MGIKGFLETSFVDWPGKLAAVVFLPGCNFRCPFCHNAELVEGGEDLPDIPLPAVLERIGELCGWVEGVVITGGEPTLHADLPDLLGALKGAGLLVKLDTNGSRPEVLRHLMEEGLVDAVDMDLKAPLRGEEYSRLAGVPVDVDLVRASLELLGRGRLPHRFRTTYVPGLLDGRSVGDIARALPPSSEYVLQPFRPGRTLDAALGEVPPPEEAAMEGLRALLPTVA